ncbi:hypothetical protein Tlie_0200 [Thermovirga lienii DSM 17291]|uniref:Uncharacterized protein n=1 Tax=Thermovirga lienii (strain ATCC BAA-1197 / DSM 17291 / Cas60314) TaxID=580340 RepID=G7V6B5_THELD|nr:glycerol dehydratase reactivase beta/small subunit family protein [Thermovirga lienii]AER65944.1 hypothetical protein Tlie_0200 [Thermovirga lienii DSM 17291]
MSKHGPMELKGIQENRPVIVLLLSDSCPEEWVRHIGAGCEEEGVPLAWGRRSDGRASSLAKEAAVISRLEVGIGLDRTESAVTMFSLSEHPPYVAAFHGGDPLVLRWLGHNASRLVKREPLLDKEEFLKKRKVSKDLSKKLQSAAPKLTEAGEESYEELVKKVVAYVLEGLGNVRGG